MINSKHKLTVDDLIVEYMIYKVKYGYEPQFSTSEFIDFLKFFETKMKVEDSLYDGRKLFNRFFERKIKHDWSIYESQNIIRPKPHMDIEYSIKDQDYIIKANYKLSDYDRSVINTYFMDNGLSKFNDYRGNAYKIRSIISEYLSNMPKRKIDETIEVSDDELKVGKFIALKILINIWDSYIDKKIENHKWPAQCRDINKYLFEVDFANIIGVKSIKNELIELYNVISKKIAIMYHQDKDLKINSYYNKYLARSNYDCLIKGYEEIMSIAFGKFNKSLSIDLSIFSNKNNKEISELYDSISNSKPQKLVKNLEKSNKNQ